MKILVFGAGVLGCNLANDLFRAGKDVTLLARGVWGEKIQKNGLKIKSIFSPWTTVSRVPVVSMDLKKITIGQLRGALSNEVMIHEIFSGTKIKVVYEPNMGDYLLCHAAFVLPVAFACYKANGDLRKFKGNTAYLNRLIDANIEGYRAIQNAGHEILPKADKDFESDAYRKTCMRFFKLMCATSLGKICASDHAMNAVGEMNALNRDIKRFFEKTGAKYPTWQALEQECGRYGGKTI